LLQFKTIKITRFEVPREIRTNTSFLLLLIYTRNMPPHSTSYFWLPVRVFHYIIPNALLRAVCVLACVLGVLEGMYVASVVSQLAWVDFATIFGMPVLTRLNTLCLDGVVERKMKVIMGVLCILVDVEIDVDSTYMLRLCTRTLGFMRWAFKLPELVT
jgi:hypothetical protein